MFRIVATYRAVNSQMNLMFYSTVLKLVIFLGFVFHITAEQDNDYEIYDVTPKSKSHIKFLKYLHENNQEIDFLTDITDVGKRVQIMVKRNTENIVVAFNLTFGLKPILHLPSIRPLLDIQMSPDESKETFGFLNFTWNRYHSLDEIYNWLDRLEKKYSNIITKVNIGTTHEGRNITGVIINYNAKKISSNYSAIIEGGIHAREWISPATVTWIIKEFLISNDAEIKYLAEAYVWHIFPVINPDGYAYTFSHDRMWKKNRYQSNDISGCSGVDLNRNFNTFWINVPAPQGVCSQDYAGPSALSEPETRAFTKYILSLRRNVTALFYFAFHSYSQTIVLPFGQKSDHQWGAHSVYLIHLAKAAIDKIKSLHGTTYELRDAIDPYNNFIVTGTSCDWAKDKARIPIPMSFELRDTGVFGFLLPPAQIIPNCEEVLAGLVEIEKMNRKLHYFVLKNVEEPTEKAIVHVARKRNTTSSGFLEMYSILSYVCVLPFVCQLDLIIFL